MTAPLDDPMEDPIDDPLDDQTVHLWEIGLENPGPHDDALAEQLPADEQAVATRRRHVDDRRRYLRAHAALRTLLATYVERRVAFHSFCKSVDGKPSLCSADGEGRAHEAPGCAPVPCPLAARYATLEFNLAHSGAWAVAALGLAPLGVDVECVRPLSDWNGMIARCCSPAEQLRLAQVDVERRTREFFHCWTGKEALLKGIGCGIAIDVREIETPDVAAMRGTTLQLQTATAPISLGRSTWQWAWFDVDERHLGAIAVGPKVRRIVRRRFASRERPP